MIGLVVVSHSRALADAAVGLAREMVDADAGLTIEVAAGLDETTFGTDAAAVAEALGRADSPDGVLLLLDLGSAVLSAEMALEFVDPDLAGRVTISSAPLVEGLVAAAVLAATGAPLEAVAAEAARGLAGKQQHLGGADPEDGPAADADVPPADASAEIDVLNPHGLHARPAAALVALVSGFDATTRLTHLGNGRGPVDAGSLSLVATLDARQGDRLRVEASGPAAADAVAAVVDFAGRGFDDLDGPAVAGASDEPAAEASAGSGLDLAIGPAVVLAVDVDLSGYDAGDPAEEQRRSDAARDAVRARLEELAADGGAAGAIFTAQVAMLDDPSVLPAVASRIEAGEAAPTAWQGELGTVAARFEGLADAYQQERAQDVRSILRRVLLALTGQAESGPGDGPDGGPEGGPYVVVLPEIDAATAATLDGERVAGVVTTGGGATGHGAIVTRSRGIPILTGVAEAATVRTGQVVAFDARTGEFVADPDDSTAERFADLRRARAEERAGAVAAAHEPAVTTDGTQVVVLGNVASAAEAEAAAQAGAEGAGLVRTEVLFGDRPTLPSVDEQAAAFVAIGAALGGRPITVRTWDVGGDKPLRFLPQPHEDNPFLGERGLRLSRREPEALRSQLAAVCLAARETAVKVMFPMVTTVDEVDWALGVLDDAAADVGGRPDGLQVGIMVEVPAAALRARQLTERLDFVSIGTNDLTQYTLAAERGNAAVAGLADGLDPAVLGLIERVCGDVRDGVEVAVCGDLASQPLATPLLVGAGVHELSAVASSVPGVKARVRSLARAECTDLLARALACGSAAEVRALLA